MENLFSEDPQFRRVQYKKLSDNVREWQQEISALISERLPKDLGLDVKIVFQTVNEERGYAVGTAIAKDTNTERQIGIPVVIKNWHLAPIDLFFSEGKIYPLSDDNIAKIFYQNSLGVGLAPQKSPPNMADDAFADMRHPPLGGKYSYSAPFSMLKLLSGTLGSEDLKLFKRAFVETPSLLGGYHKRGTFDVVVKYAEEKEKPDKQDQINKERTVSVFTIKKDGPDSYRLYSAPDEVYEPVLISTNRQGLRNWLDMRKSELWDYERDPLNIVDKYGHYTLEIPKSPYGEDLGSTGYNLGVHKNPWVFDPLQDDRTVTNISSFGRYAVRDKDGVLAKGWVIPNVVDFDGKKIGTKLFLGKALASIQDRIAGIPVKGDDDDIMLRADRADTGKIGTLVYREGDQVLATAPFQITGVTIFKNLRSLAGFDYKGNQINLILSPNVNGIVPISDNEQKELGPLCGPGKNYIVSAKMFFVRMPRLCDVSGNTDDFKKVALEHFDINPVKVAVGNGRYLFRGGKISKYAKSFQKHAFDFSSLARHEAEFLLRYWGLPQEKTASVLDGVKSKIHLEVHHLHFPPVRAEVKVASDLRITELVRSIRPPIDQLVKIANSITDAQTVDSVLGLGFINEENVSRFAAVKPMLWEVSHMLAKLLLASRLGMEDIPEESARLALMHLQRVIQGIDRLKMLDEEGVDKLSSARTVPKQVGRTFKEATFFGFAR